MTVGPRKGLQGKLPFLINCSLLHKVVVEADFITVEKVEGIMVEPREKVERAVRDIWMERWVVEPRLKMLWVGLVVVVAEYINIAKEEEEVGTLVEEVVPMQ